MATAAEDDNKLHVVMFPWLAFGHIIPFLELSKFIAKKGHRVSFLSTNRNIDRLPSLPPEHSSNITLVRLTLPRLEELPENAEATMDVRTEDIEYLKKARDGLEPEVTRFLESESPDWVIYDFCDYWLPAVATRLGISGAFFSIINTWFLGFMGTSPEMLMEGSDYRKTVEDYMVPPKWVNFPTKVRYLKHEAKWMVGSSTENASGVADLYRAGKVLGGSDAIFVRDCYELVPEWVKLVEEMCGHLVVPVGLMPPATTGGENNDTWLTIKNWLDGQQKGQVVYVALGSEVMLSRDQLGELALGLELSGLPFLWALRKPAGSTESDAVELLPDGFLERTKNRGLVWTSWAPQLQILSHDSLGGFLTHCGWGSIVEGLMFGHPLIMLPFLVDQGLNARELVDKQVGVEVPRDEEDGSFTRNSVANSVSSVIIGDEGKICKAKAMEMSKMVADTELHKRYIDSFIEFLEKHRHGGLVVSNSLSFVNAFE